MKSWFNDEQPQTQAVQIIPKKRFIQLKESHVAKVGMVWEYEKR